MDVNKFSIAQMTSNADGKTSGSGTIGVYWGFISGACFVIAVAYFCLAKGEHNAILLLSSVTGFASLCMTLLMYRKSKDAAISKEIIEKNEAPQV